MKYTFLLLLSILLTLTASAQHITVNGKLVSSDNDGLPYATISIAVSSQPNVSIKKLATKENGEFSTTLEKGDYLLTFNFVGMDEVVKSINLTQSDKILNLGIISLIESSTELDELSVTAQRPLVKVEIDKLTYSAKDDPESSTSNVLDLFRKVPLVTVDGEDEIQLKGSSNFKIYINGKPSNMISSNPSQVLKSMPANSVKDVEVITDPGAKYDAEGIGGIINIVTDKRVDDGYSGSVGANGDTFGGYGGNAYLATKYGKFGFSGNAGYYYHNQPESESSFIREEFANKLIQNGTSTSNGGGIFLSGAMSYEPDTINLFNISASHFGGEFTSLSTTTANSGGVRPYSYITNNNSIANFGGMNFSADYQRSFKKKDEILTISYRFEKAPNDSEFDSEYDNVEGDFYYETGYKLRSSNSAGGQEHTAQIDYVNPLNDKHNLEAGMKYIFRDNSSRGDNTYFNVTDEVWYPDPDRKNDLDHKQNIASGYLGYSYKTGRAGLKLGLRGEHTQQDILFMSNSTDSIETSFFDLIPSATVSYQLGMTQNIRAGYNMRISRPGIWYLNPYINNMDPNNISYGNPNLDSEKQHNFNINYGSFAQKINFNVTLTYSFAQNAVTAISFIDNEKNRNATHNTYANIGKNQTVGTNIYVSWTPTSRIRTYLNGGMNYTDIKSNDSRGLSNNGFSGRAFSGLTFTLPHDIRLGANGGLFMNSIQLQTVQSPFYYYSFSLMKSFLDKKLDLTLSVQDAFSKYREISSTTTGEGFSQKSINLGPVRNLRLSVTYRFGDLKSSMKRVQRGIVNEDVMQGESNSQQGGTTTTPER